MPYLVGYTMSWKVMDDDTLFTLNIKDKNSFTATPVDTSYYPILPGDGNPVRNVVVDNDENPFTPVRGRSIEIICASTTNVNFSTFSEGEDDRWIVEVLAGSSEQRIFDGFLVLDNIQGQFLPDPTIFRLVATDNLKTLADIDFVDENGDNPEGPQRIIDLIVMCLKKTGLELPINVACNLIHESNGSLTTPAVFTASGNIIEVPNNDDTTRFLVPGKTVNTTGTTSNNVQFVIVSRTVVPLVGYELVVTGTVTDEALVNATFSDINVSPFSNLYLDAKTFEKEIGVSEDCLTVLNKIIGGFKGFLEQHNGIWWIVCVDAMRHSSLLIYSYTADGDYINSSSPSTNRVKDIAATNVIRMRNASQVVTKRRKKKYVELFYNYRSPLEKVCNINFERGDFITDMPDETVGDVTYNVKQYELDCWEKKRGAGDSVDTPDFDAYIKRRFINGIEKERFIVLTLPATQGNPKQYIESAFIPVDFQDKLSVSFDWATEVDENGTGTLNEPVASIWIEGDDGTFWKLFEDNPPGSGPRWATTTAADEYGLNANLIVPVDWANDPDTSQWHSKSVEVPPIPVGGKLRIRLIASGVFPATSDDDFNVRFTNLNIDYHAYINGSYQTITGEKHTFTNPDNYKAFISDENYIWDGIRRIFKGALLWYNGSDYALANAFYDGIEGVSGGFGIDSFGKYITNHVWNVYRKEVSIFELDLQGIDSTDALPELPAMIHRYIISDVNPETSNKYFLCVAMREMNYREGNWSATFFETYSVIAGYEFDNNKWTHKYLT